MTEAINSSWPGGISGMEEKVIRNVPMTEFKLNGTPWYSSGHESVDSRKLLATIIQSLSKIGWKFHACVNIKGGNQQ